MNKKGLLIALSVLAISDSIGAQKKWTLEECIEYALENNIQLKQNRLTNEQNKIDILQSKAQLFPSLSFSTNQNVSYRPYSQSTINLTNGTMTNSQSLVTYNGSYGLNANWTVWNGGRNSKNIKKSEYTAEISDLQTEQTANTIQEQIAQIYVQILYQTEAAAVCEEILKASQMQRDRAKEMVEVGSLAKVDLAQLEAQTSQDEYNLVNARSILENYKLQLKQLLEIVGTNDFDVATPQINDNSVLAAIPSKSEVYSSAVASRPEIQSGKLNIEAQELNIDIAKRGYYPTISLTAGIGTNHGSGTDIAFGSQIKKNWSNSIGLTLSVPIFDNRQNRTNVQKAKLTKQSSELDLQDTQKELYSSIEEYWLNATTSQQQYIYAKSNVESMQESYDLVSEQFRLGLKNIVELTTGKNNLLQAEQQMLQSKYTTLLNIAMLRFYQGEGIKL
ncbi:MAG: TolC family protein [Bacteroides sp.]|nr:TolC family protein [Roseburia sp.]MCM1345572.1 TolC family protein [Bacteroides sp.]MCM1420770.1 TolC family protein [Bacteroides sp.]